MNITKDNAIALLCCAKIATRDLLEREEELSVSGLDSKTPGTMDYIRNAALDWQSEQIAVLYADLGIFEEQHPLIMKECYERATDTERTILGINSEEPFK